MRSYLEGAVTWKAQLPGRHSYLEGTVVAPELVQYSTLDNILNEFSERAPPLAGTHATPRIARCACATFS